MNNRIKNIASICFYISLVLTLLNLFDRAWILEDDIAYKQGYKNFQSLSFPQKKSVLSIIKRN